MYDVYSTLVNICIECLSSNSAAGTKSVVVSSNDNSFNVRFVVVRFRVFRVHERVRQQNEHKTNFHSYVTTSDFVPAADSNLNTLLNMF